MNAKTKFLWELCKIYRISSSKRHDVYLILGLVGSTFIYFTYPFPNAVFIGRRHLKRKYGIIISIGRKILIFHLRTRQTNRKSREAYKITQIFWYQLLSVGIPHANFENVA